MSRLTVFRTIINLGCDIEVDAYTANEQRPDGSWINYLSGRGLAESIENPEDTTRYNRLPKQLKALLGADFTIRYGKHKMTSGGVVSVNLWKTQYAAKYYRYHDRQGNEKAGKIIDALIATTLDIIINDAFEREYEPGFAQSSVNRILDQANPWVKVYEKDFCKKVYKWYGADFYWRYCYHWMSPAERIALDLANPVLDGERFHRIHQHIDRQTKGRLIPYLHQLYSLVMSASSKQDFETHYARLYGSDQLELNLNF